MTEPSAARLLALKTLLTVEKKKAFASLALQKAKLSERELRLATELVYGTLREQSLLDWWLERGTEKVLSKLASPVRVNLRLALYQCAFADAIPERAAVEQAVALARKFTPQAAKFVNWALRATLRQAEPFALPKEDDPLTYLAIRYSHPKWLVQLWLEQLGEERTLRLLAANQTHARLAVRVNTLRTGVQELQAALSDEGIQSRPGLLPEALEVTHGRPAKTAAFAAGMFMIQSEASQLASHLLAPRPGERVLDLAAAPGGKTTHLAQLMENRGEIVACDLYRQRLNLIEENCRRLGVKIVRTLCADGRQIKGRSEGTFSKILLDAPCSGLGVLRGKPDLRWHKSPEEIAGLPLLQKELLSAAASVTAPGGEICYSTCTINKAENQEVVTEFLAAHPGFQLSPFGERLPAVVRERFSDADGMLQLLPSEHKLDGFFFALLKRLG